MKSQRDDAFSRFLASRWGRLTDSLAPFLGAAVYAVVLSYFSVLRYEAFTDAWDFGGFVQSLSDAVKGGFFLQTIDGYFAKGFPQVEVISFFGLHFSPILYLLVPVYSLFPYPQTLLVVQSIALSLGAVPVYWLAKKRLGMLAALVFLVIYLTYPPLIGINLTDFHPEAFMVPLLLYAIYFGLDKRWKAAAPFFVLALMVIEEAGILVFGVLFFLFIYHRAWQDRRTSFVYVLAFAGSIAYTAVASQLPYVFGLNPTGFTLTLNSDNYSALGATSALGLPVALLRSPGNVLRALSYQLQYKVSFVIEIIGPVALLPLFAPEALVMTLPWLGTAFLSNYPGYYTIYGFHQAFIIFFAFPAAILGLARLRRMSPRISPRVFAGYLLVLLIVSVAFTATQAVPSSVYGGTFTPTKENLAEDQVLAFLPSDASVLTTSDIFPHVANRLDAYTVPPATLRSGYALVDQEILSEINPQYILLNVGSGDGNIVNETNAILDSKVYSGGYGLVAYSDKVMLLEQGYSGAPLLYNNPGVYNSSNLEYAGTTTAVSNDTLYFPKGTNWVNMWFGPYTFLPPGNYTATFTLRTTSELPPDATVMRIDVDTGNLVTVTKEILTGSDFPNGGWQTFSLRFQLTEPSFDVQFRGMYPTNETGIYLQSVDVANEG